MFAGFLFLLQKYLKIASTKSRKLLFLLFFFPIFSYFSIFDDDDDDNDDNDDDDDDDDDNDDDDDVIMTSFTDILKTCIPIHLCLKCIMGLRYAWLPPAHCFNKTNTSILTLL